MIEAIVCCIIVLSLTTMYLSFHAGEAGPSDQMINVGVAVIFFHAVFVLMCELFFSLKPYVDIGAPFGLLYGPLCYFSFYALSGKLPGRTRVVLHLIPVGIGLVVYLMLLLLPAFRTAYCLQILRWLYIFVGISMISYSGLLLFYNDRDDKQYAHEGKKVVFSVLLLVFIVALLFITLSYSGALPRGEVSAFLTRMIVYFVMLVVVIFAFRYQVDRILKETRTQILSQPIIYADKSQADNLPYRKSAIAEELLATYELRLEKMMTDNELYLDAEMTLEKLARLMNIPKHHLTQLFSVRIGKNFYQYLNVFRVNYACLLLKDESLDFKLEEIGFRSGFNSKTSFNRYFKANMGCTPSEYKDQQNSG
ncbi:helix-turn-helix domain-containing protein [Pedobacter caeni]|uniref:Transcriptional regulator, AraC family n=1 Tax=Pedobacter caeni TaxID=288992 RepID=A0A1M5PTP0_9SPHI|nr:helix-turn-helix domain-containing protein [Pedobacter caeni]SHH04980.1 transcriptional regulator, AraC family [Pedobacter caeni]